MGGDAHAHTGVGAIGNHRFDVGSVKTHFLVEHGVVIALQCLPIGYGLVPILALRRIFTAFDVGEGHLVGCHHAAACTHFDAEVAQRQAAFHRQTADSLAGIFHKITRGTAGRHLRHHIESEVLGCHSLAQPAVHGDAHRLGPCLEDALRSQYHLHLTGTDTKGYGTHGSVGRRMGVSTYDGHPRQGQAAFGPYDVDDAVLGIHHPEMCQPEFLGIPCQRVYLLARYRVLDGFVLVVRRRIMVRHTENLFRTEAAEPPCPQALESLRTGHLMAVEAVDIKLCGTIFHLLHHVGVPDLIKQCIHNE